MVPKLLQDDDWKKFAKGQAFDDKALLKVLAALDKAEKSTPADWLEALEALDKQITALRKKVAGNKEVTARLDSMDKVCESERKEAAEASPALLTTKMVSLVRAVPKGEELHTMIVTVGKKCAVLLSRKDIPNPRRSLLTDYLGDSAGAKVILARCIFESAAHTFVVEGEATGLAKRLKAALQDQTGMKVKLRVRGSDGGEVEEDLDGDNGGGDESLEDFAAQLKRVAQETARSSSQAADEVAKLTGAVADDTAARLKAVAEESAARMKAASEQTAATLKAVADESSARMAKVAQSTSPERIAQIKALAPRLQTVRAELERLQYEKTPIAEDIRKKLGEATTTLQAREVEGVPKLLEQLEQLAKAIAARRGDAGAAATAAAAAAAKRQQAKQAYEGAWAPMQADVDTAREVVTTTPEAFDDDVIKLWSEALKTLDGAVERQDWAAAELALDGLPERAAQLLQTQADYEAYIAKRDEVQADVDAADQLVAVDAADGLPDDVANYRIAIDYRDDRAGDKDWVEALDGATKAGEWAQEINANYAQWKAVQKKIDDRKSTLLPALEIAEKHPERLQKSQLQDLENAFKSMMEFDQAKRWVDLEKLLPELDKQLQRVLDQQHNFELYHAEIASGMEQVEAFRGLWHTRTPMPDGLSGELKTAIKAGNNARDGVDWVEATKQRKEAKRLAALVMPTLTAGQAFYAEYAKHAANVAQAEDASIADPNRLASLIIPFNDVRSRLGKHVAAGAWDQATALLAEMQAAADKLAEAYKSFVPERAVFDKLWAKLKNLAKAREIAVSAAPGLDATAVGEFRRLHTLANDARNAGDYEAAKPHLAPLQEGINALVKAKQAHEKQRLAYEQELAGIDGLEHLREVAKANIAEVATESAAFVGADAKRALAVTPQQWSEALAAAKELATAAKALVDAWEEQYQAAGDAEMEPLQEALDKLEPGVDDALAYEGGAFVEALSDKLTELFNATKADIDKTDPISAQLNLAMLGAALKAFDDAKKAEESVNAHIETARDGDVQKARDKDFGIQTLNTLRNDGLNKLGADIEASRDAGRFEEAERLIVAWTQQATAWQSARNAYITLTKKDNLRPNVERLKQLTGLPGGGEVLDAMLASLPDDKPQAFWAGAMEARYGFKTQQFTKKKNDRASDVRNQTPIDDTLPDKSLKALYEMLGDVPLEHIMGNVTELIRYTEETGGASYGGGKVCMYCGRADDPKASQQKFNQKNDIVPDGELVDPDCLPVDETPIPYFRFAALHEVGHAEDRASGYMERTDMKGHAGWQSHTAEQVAEEAAKHFKYDLDYVKAMLADKASKPPAGKPDAPDDREAGEWDQCRLKVEAWAVAIRVGTSLWNNASRSKQNALGARIYHESYDGKWVSYLFAARAQGISGYQFRAPGEWFAELYAAHHTKKLKPGHPAMKWLTEL